MYPTIYVWSKNKKNIKFFLLQIFIFIAMQMLCILHERVFVLQKFKANNVTVYKRLRSHSIVDTKMICQLQTCHNKLMELEIH